MTTMSPKKSNEKNSSSFSFVDRRTILRCAGNVFFRRGEEYFQSGQVEDVTEFDGVITAAVLGTQIYRVKLWARDGEIQNSCTCPVYTDDGSFCKHCVAVGLMWISGKKNGGSPEKEKETRITMKDVQSHLLTQNKEVLVKIIMDQAMEEDLLREKLQMGVATSKPRGINLSTFRKAIDHAVNPGGYVGYYEVDGYARGVHQIIDSIRDLLNKERATEVIELAEYALRAVEGAAGSVDDSSAGQMGDIFEGLQKVHHAACEKAKPDPVELANRLFDWELGTEWDTFYGAVERYKNILGKKGLATYQKRAEAAWEKVPILQPDQKDSEKFHYRFRIKSIMEALAKVSSNVEALVAIKSRDLSSPYYFLEIAEVYKKAGQKDKSVEWAEKGIHAFPKRTDSRLREFLAQEYHRLKRHEDAMELIWAEFAESPDLEHYKLLKNHADQIAKWSAWREKAIFFLREVTAKEKQRAQKNQWSWSKPDHSKLVQIFLWEKDAEAAWQEAKSGGCSHDLWMDLAKRRESDHPENALAVYRGQIEPTLEGKNYGAYAQAVSLLKRIHKLMNTLNCRDKFSDYILTLRLTHKLKRNFIKLLDQARWS